MERIDTDILDMLRATLEHAWAPYSGFRVAAVAVAADGRRFAGCNVETAHYKSVCAEASALSAMVAGGRTRLSEIYILADGEAPCPPCGDCRQRIREFSDAGTRIILVDGDGRAAACHSLDELLPASFGPELLTRR
ncbi:MAG: cytidine deaminase [Wenzhouxiangellaceae bacterium]|nr:cytidine deaminase [Wenzhouxiangellaceae bacterium]